MVDDSESTVDTKPRCLPALYDRQYESFTKYILLQGKPVDNAIGQLKVDPIHHPVIDLLAHQI